MNKSTKLLILFLQFESFKHSRVWFDLQWKLVTIFLVLASGTSSHERWTRRSSHSLSIFLSLSISFYLSFSLFLSLSFLSLLYCLCKITDVKILKKRISEALHKTNWISYSCTGFWKAILEIRAIIMKSF